MAAGLIAGIIGAIAGLIAVNVGGVMVGVVVFFAVFLLLSSGGLVFLATLSPNVIVFFIALIILIKLLGGKK